jgi:general stress protein 26
MRRSQMANKISGTTSLESNQKIYDFLKEHSIGVLATVDPNNNPHAATVYYSIDEEFNIFFTTKRETKKHDNLRHNNHAMLVTYEAFTQTTVQITGVAEDISETPEAGQVYNNTTRAAQKTSEAGVAPISKLYAGSYVAYRLKPVQIRMAVFIHTEPGGYDMYETIDFKS